MKKIILKKFPKKEIYFKKNLKGKSLLRIDFLVAFELGKKKNKKKY